jgi:hypothetical protein
VIRVEVWYEPAQGTRRQLVGEVKVTNDGSASDGSGDSPTGNYRVEAGWLPRGETRWERKFARVENFARRHGVLVLLRQALLGLEGRIE